MRERSDGRTEEVKDAAAGRRSDTVVNGRAIPDAWASGTAGGRSSVRASRILGMVLVMRCIL